MFTIDHGVPVALRRKYPFRQMEIGDSFFIAGATYAEPKAKGLYSSAKRLGIKITMRNATENGVSGIRVWRIERSEAVSP